MRQAIPWVLLCGCLDYGVAGPKAEPAATDSGTTVRADTADTAPPDSGTPPIDTAVTCAHDWPDRSVAIDASCPDRPAADWSLRERWRYDLPDTEYATAHAGRFSDADGDGIITPADPMGLWVGSYRPDGALDGQVLLDADGAPVRAELGHVDAWRVYYRTADFDPARLGSEVAASMDVRRDSERWTAGDEAELYADAGYALESVGVGVPWFADLDGDGRPEAVVDKTVFDPVDGTVLFEVQGAEWDPHAVVADLDRDGSPEIVNVPIGGGVGIWPADGSAPMRCAASDPPGDIVIFAIANFDADDDAEVLAAGTNTLSICDADGTVLADIASPSSRGALVGVGELDGDPEPEIVMDYNGVASGTSSGIIVYDETLPSSGASSCRGPRGTRSPSPTSTATASTRSSSARPTP